MARTSGARIIATIVTYVIRLVDITARQGLTAIICNDRLAQNEAGRLLLG